VESPRVTADIVEATEFPELARRYNVYAVPKIVINDTHEFVGALPEPHFITALARAVIGDGAGPLEETAEGAAEVEATPLDSGLGDDDV